MLFWLKKIFKTEHIVLDVMFIYVCKKIYHTSWFNLSKNKESKILFIFGCQRSGTSLMNRIFARDLNVSVYRESSELSSNDVKKLRLNPIEDVKKIISKNRASLIVVKPLVESQNTPELLDAFDNSKGLWMYRNYKDVAASNSKRFNYRQSVRDLKMIVEQNTDSKTDSWRTEKVSEYVYSTIAQYFSDEMNEYDAAALFWFARNQLFYELDLEHNSRVFLCRYEELVLNPVVMMQNIYRFLEIDPRKIPKIQEVHAKSIGKGKKLQLSPAVERLCNELQTKLDRSYSCQQESRVERERLTA